MANALPKFNTVCSPRVKFLSNPSPPPCNLVDVMSTLQNEESLFVTTHKY